MLNKQVELQNQTIAQLVSILNKYESVVAVALMGSHVNDKNTAFSDIDLLVVFKDDKRDGLREVFEDVLAIKPVLSSLYQVYDKMSLILFEDGVRLDMDMGKRSEFDGWMLEPVKVLFDKEGVFDRMLKKSGGKRVNADKPKWNDKEGSFVDWFFWMFRQAYAYVCQSEVMLTKSFEKKDLALASIKSIRDKLLNVVYYLHGQRDYLVDIDAGWLAKFEKTYPSNLVGEIKSSVWVLVDLYEDIMSRYCAKERLAFPIKKVIKIKELLDEFDKI